MRLLVISDIHGNYPALMAVDQELQTHSFDYIINCGDSTVYSPFANETLKWLQHNKAISILGNTDKKVIKLLRNKTFRKPSKHEKRIMYLSTATSLTHKNGNYLKALPKSRVLELHRPEHNNNQIIKIGIYHGSPTHHHEFLFENTPKSRFSELAEQTDCQLILTGHSHTPYHKIVSSVHFINPGSVGRMFDADPRASCATIEIGKNETNVNHFRINYDIAKNIQRLREENLPEIYCTMCLQGKKLN